MGNTDIANVDRFAGTANNANGKANGKVLPVYTWEDLKKHNVNDSKWIAVDGNVYDVTNFSKRHPGGARIMNHFTGHDASVRFVTVTCVRLGLN